MHTCLLALALALAAFAPAAFAQASDERYPGAADPATVESATTDAAEAAFAGDADADAASEIADVAPAAAEAEAAGTITLPVETPPPVLAEQPEPAAPTVAEPTAAAAPTAAPPASPPPNPLAADQPAAAPPAADPVAPPAAVPAAAAPAEAPKPRDLMRALLTTPASDQLAGVPMSLGAALRDATTRAEQTERAQAYWDLSAAVAQYYLALLERSEIAALHVGIAAPAAAWDVAAADADRRASHTRQAALAAQLRMHALLGAAAGPSLPLPADAPHCGRYNTRYDEIFAGREQSAAAQLNNLLPQMHGELLAQTRQVADADQWLAYVSQHREDANDGAGVLRSYQLMTERRRAFLETARDYNKQIAAYAELATPDQVGPDRLVAMLIRTSYTAGEPDGETSVVQQASALDDSAEAAGESATASTNNDGRPRTFAWRPLDRLRDRERSIVTVRRKIFNALRPRQ